MAGQLAAQSLRELVELPVDVPAAGYEPHAVTGHVGERAETVVLQLEQPIGVIEGLSGSGSKQLEGAEGSAGQTFDSRERTFV